MLQILKASAGSGKTYMLARKYIEILLEGKDRYAYRHILAVTFTNKATDEMKGRILEELYVLSTDPGASGYHEHFAKSMSDADMQRKAKAVLSDILHDYSAFSVSTIDRFFQQTLKAFSREIGQFASYQVELDKDSLVAESVDRILDSLTEEDSGLLSWLTDNVLEQIEQGGRYSMDANLLDMAKRLKSPQRKEVVERYGMDPDEKFPMRKLIEIRETCREIISDFREEVYLRAAAALDVLEQAGVDPAESNRGFLRLLYDYRDLAGNDIVPSLPDSFITKALDSEQWFSKSKAPKFLPFVYPFLEAPLWDFCDLFDDEFKVYNTAVILDGQLYGLGVAAELNRTFNELMKEKNVLCIDDSNTILRDIIDGSDAPFVYEKLGVRYEHFLLDEFQDTAGVQWDNFSPLLHESDSHGGENLIVGDVKQSIYRWRGSDWKLLNETVPAEFPGHEEKVLDTNFRSLKNIINFNNEFFRTVSEMLDRMNGNGNGGPISSIYSDVEQKVRTSGKGERVRPDGSVSLTFCGKNDELERVYKAVVEFAGTGADAKYSDVTVLVRSNATGEAVSMYLIDKGIPVITDDSLHIRTSITVRRLVSLMSFIDNPDDTVNGYLAKSLNIEIPRVGSSIMDMAEALFRELKRNDYEELWRGEVQHIQSFMDVLQDYVSLNGNNLRGFLKYWEGENPSISSPASGNSVRIMTIHKSKGLAAPYIIIPFAENITLYKPGNHWCVPDLKQTPLEGIAEGVYDVKLSKPSEKSLFAEDYKKENFLQQVDNLNTLYVAMTRARKGMHIISKMPSGKCLDSIKKGDSYQFSDFSQILYWFASDSRLRVTEEKDCIRFDLGEIVPPDSDGNVTGVAYRTFCFADSDELPSFRERGRLKFTADSLDFFSEEGGAGISASNRIKGVVLHDILSRVEKAEDLDAAVKKSLGDGDITAEEAREALELLSARIASAAGRGWFPSDYGRVLNESTLIDEAGGMHRPDRVIVAPDGAVTIIDYKFGDPHPSYAAQLRRYASLWRRLGHPAVSAWLWYVHTDEVVECS